MAKKKIDYKKELKIEVQRHATNKMILTVTTFVPTTIIAMTFAGFYTGQHWEAGVIMLACYGVCAGIIHCRKTDRLKALGLFEK